MQSVLLCFTLLPGTTAFVVTEDAEYLTNHGNPVGEGRHIVVAIRRCSVHLCSGFKGGIPICSYSFSALTIWWREIIVVTSYNEIRVVGSFRM